VEAMLAPLGQHFEPLQRGGGGGGGVVGGGAGGGGGGGVTAGGGGADAAGGGGAAPPAGAAFPAEPPLPALGPAAGPLTGAGAPLDPSAATVVGVVEVGSVDDRGGSAVVLGGSVVGDGRRGNELGAASVASPAMMLSVAETPTPVARTRPPGAAHLRLRI
jgi:hypothetical protein